jgi:Flp pilus assembly secretin CpaC
VVARPQLAAYRGEPSKFLIGRRLNVALSGVNAAILEQIDIGIELKVTPIEITPTGTQVRIEAGRSFLTADPAEVRTTFRQRVVATAEIAFSETLLLSSLSEAVEDRTFSKTPVLGDIRLVGNAFNERNTLHRKDWVIVLVTPARPTTAPFRPVVRSEVVASLAQLSTAVIDPISNAEATTAKLARNRFFTRMRRGHLSSTLPATRRAAEQMMGELLAPNQS